jgi:mannitol-specific phosphotransferase system IIBC component
MKNTILFGVEMATNPRKKATHVSAVVVETDHASEEALNIENRRTQELVFAMVAPIGSGATTAADMIRKKIEENFGYEVNIIKISSLINDRAESLGVTARLLPRRFRFDASDEELVVHKAVEEVVPFLG